MSLLSPSRPRYTLTTLLWVTMLFLIWQHYCGLNQMLGRPIDKDISLVLPQSNAASSNTQPDDKPLSKTPTKSLPQQPDQLPAPATADAIDALISSVDKTSLFFVNESPQPSEFAKMGGRLQILETWLSARATLHPKMTHAQLQSLDNHIERTIITLFPFVGHPAQPKNAQPFTTLRETFVPHTQGIVMVGSKSTLHSLAHTILNIRLALNSSLPIQIYHAGETDFPPSARRFISRLSHNITIHDLKHLISDPPSLSLSAGGPPTLAPLSALASTFTHLLLIAPGTTFLRTPSTLLTHPSFLSTGALFFHSHLHSVGGGAKPAHTFWQSQLKNHVPSAALRASRAYNEGYADEADAAVVVLDKSRVGTLMGMLHACWQHTRKVREGYTYRYAADGRDSWWFGFELAGAGYKWGNDGGGGGYGGTIGWASSNSSSSSSSSSSHHSTGSGGVKTRICGTTTLHLAPDGNPLWYSGGLRQPHGSTEYDVPTQWMVEGEWQRAPDELGMDCMEGGEARDVSDGERAVLERSVREARAVDGKVRRVLEGERNRPRPRPPK
ncbi:MAG: hypothetical protein Q9184_008146 [Pyrenodesmia sp. 2 TL-2023]